MYIYILYFPHLLGGFLLICTPVHVYICGLWLLRNTTSLFLIGGMGSFMRAMGRDFGLGMGQGMGARQWRWHWC
jgi:hypothetical protein